MRIIITGAGLCLAIALVAVSVAISFEFGFAMGTTPWRAWIYGLAVACADGFKPLLPFFIMWGWREGRAGVVVAGCLLATLATAMSIASGIGFASENRSAMTLRRETVKASLDDALRERDAIAGEMQRLGAWRPSKAIEEAIGGALNQVVTTGGRMRGTVKALSQDCRVPETQTKGTCADVASMREELARAVRGERLTSSAGELSFRIERLRERGGAQDVDPQISALARIMPYFDMGQVRSGLALLVALLIEAGSSLALFVATGHWARTKEGRGQQVDAGPATLEVPASTLCVQQYWLLRLFPQQGLQTPVEEIYVDYLGCCREWRIASLDRQDFFATLSAICARIGLEVEGGQVAGVRIGAAYQLSGQQENEPRRLI